MYQVLFRLSFVTVIGIPSLSSTISRQHENLLPVRLQAARYRTVNMTILHIRMRYPEINRYTRYVGETGEAWRTVGGT